MNAGVRLMFFWVRRNNVGDARLTWRAGHGDHRVLNFLVGSDPDRAPRRINRWGFIAEEIRPPDADLLGIMTQSDEESLEEAESENGEAPGTDRTPYRAIRTTIRNGTATSGVFRLSGERPLTYRDLDTLLQWLPAETPARRAVSVPSGTRPGFLFAVEELITSTLDQCRAASPTRPAALPYVYNNTFYTLRLRK
ncbi:MAG: hypothetical protein EHM55_22165, partial [Acidobacteria bacterium]